MWVYIDTSVRAVFCSVYVIYPGLEFRSSKGFTVRTELFRPLESVAAASQGCYQAVSTASVYMHVSVYAETTHCQIIGLICMCVHMYVYIYI